ncbi:hypothetical protein DKX38_020554 [Salix brachista]|uniref:Uncharacterized protein n=1 Tax=Salix brachista TaxID=2182728 RepID=A0A5N5KDB3_9ROSI|nr:hypothetical protein DKX38_020554 [Salix brachista]
MMSSISSSATEDRYETNLKALCTCRGDRALKNSGLFEYLWSVEVDLTKASSFGTSQQISATTVTKPKKAMTIRYLDTCEELKSFLKERESMSGDIHSSNASSRRFSIPAMNPFGKGKSKPDQTEASGVLPNSKGKSKPIIEFPKLAADFVNSRFPDFLQILTLFLSCDSRQ